MKKYQKGRHLAYEAFVGVLTCFALIRVFGVVPSQFLYFMF
jgi:hypothetical protein